MDGKMIRVEFFFVLFILSTGKFKIYIASVRALPSHLHNSMTDVMKARLIPHVVCVIAVHGSAGIICND